MKTPLISKMTIEQFEETFPNEDACKEYLKRKRWPKDVRCPYCRHQPVKSISTMPYKWECTSCAKGRSYRFSILVGTIFQNTNQPLLVWFRVIHLLLSSSKISALEVYRQMGFGSYETAHRMCKRIRAKIDEPEFKKLFGGLAATSKPKGTPKEDIFDAFTFAMYHLYDRWIKLNYFPQAKALRSMLDQYRALIAAYEILNREDVSAEFAVLLHGGKETQKETVEYLVIQPKWRRLFTLKQLDTARDRLMNASHNGSSNSEFSSHANQL